MAAAAAAVPLSAEHPFLDLANETLFAAKELEANAKWQRVLTKDDTNLDQVDLNNGCSIPCYRVETIIEKNCQDLKNKIWKVASTKDAQINDPKVMSWNLLSEGDNWRIMTQINGMSRPAWDRQTVFCQTEYVEGDTTYLVAHSVEHPLAPREDKKYVRTNMHMSVYKFQALGPNRTAVSRIAQVDPCGWIPTTIIKKYSGNMVDMFNKWKKE